MDGFLVLAVSLLTNYNYSVLSFELRFNDARNMKRRLYDKRRPLPRVSELWLWEGNNI